MTTISNKRASKEALFCIGSNCGDRKENVATALERLGKLLRGFRHSSIYATPDCHGGQKEYLNAVCSGETELTPEQAEAACKEIEVALGRDTEARRRGDVPVDVDLVKYDGNILREKDHRSEFFLLGYRELMHEQTDTKPTA